MTKKNDFEIRQNECLIINYIKWNIFNVNIYFYPNNIKTSYIPSIKIDIYMFYCIYLIIKTNK